MMASVSITAREYRGGFSGVRGEHSPAAGQVADEFGLSLRRGQGHCLRARNDQGAAEVILEVFANFGRGGNQLDPMPLELFGIADSGAEEHQW